MTSSILKKKQLRSDSAVQSTGVPMLRNRERRGIHTQTGGAHSGNLFGDREISVPATRLHRDGP